jgi:hypothetical protein
VGAPEFTIEQQIACVKREITMRGQRCARLTDGKQRREAAREIELMRAVLVTLLGVEGGEVFRRTGKVRAQSQGNGNGSN